MKHASDNPSANKLPAGINEESLSEAVERSGYPLQGIAANILARHLNVTEEWSYVDRESKEQRSLDLFCYKELVPRDKARRIVPALILLVECKRSDLPYIFFKGTVDRRSQEIPKVLGLPHVDLEINRGKDLLMIPVAESFQLGKHPFFASLSPTCSSFSKAARSGKRLKLTGTDPFNRIVMPLVSAFEHASAYYRPTQTHDFYFANLTLCICVLDAPLVIAEGGPEHTKLTLAPWVRVIRQEVTLPTPGWFRRERYYGIDVVHRDFLEIFLKEHIAGLAGEFAKRALSLENVLHSGKGSLSKEGDWDWTDLVPK
jgi:hypothetical protein